MLNSICSDVSDNKIENFKCKNENVYEIIFEKFFYSSINNNPLRL